MGNTLRSSGRKPVSFFVVFLKVMMGVSILFSLVLAGNMVYRILINSNYTVQPEHLYLIIALFLAGFIGDRLSNILEKVLEKITKEKISDYFTKENLLEDERFKGVLEDAVNLKVGDLLTENRLKKDNLLQNVFKELLENDPQFRIMRKNWGAVADQKNLIEEPAGDNEFDTVIMPCSWSLDGNLKYELYFCQKDRSIQKNARYIALYGFREIHIVGERVKVNSQRELENIISLKPGLRDWLDSQVEVGSDVKYMDYYLISNSRRISIKHDGEYAFVRNQRYTNYQSLLNALSTDELF